MGGFPIHGGTISLYIYIDTWTLIAVDSCEKKTMNGGFDYDNKNHKGIYIYMVVVSLFFLLLFLLPINHHYCFY